MESKGDENEAPQTGNEAKRPVVCVFCGSSSGKSADHLAAARDLAKSLAKHNAKLVYGGGTAGVMGELAKAMVSLSGPDAVHGVLPEALLKYERKNGSKADPEKLIDPNIYGRTTIVKDMHTRKQMMAQEVLDGGASSGFVALSGGYGTLEEIVEMVTWNQLGIHARPIVLHNVDGCWDGLLQWVRKAVDSGFISESNSTIMVEGKTGEEVVECLRHYEVSKGRFTLKWNEK